MSASGWQILGELKLMLVTDVHATVSKWLAVILSRLELQEDFVNKVLTSAQEALRRAVPAVNSTRSGHLHLFVFIPIDSSAKHQSWGFFRIEKLEHSTDTATPNHTIEFYLYLES